MNSIVTINAKIKKIGDQQYKHIMIKIPEESKKVFIKYNFEIIEFDPIIPNIVTIFVNEDENEIFSININKAKQNSFQDAFEKIYQFLTTQKELNEISETISEQNPEEKEGKLNESCQTISENRI